MSDFWTSEKGYKIYKNGPIGKKVLEQKCPEDCVSVKMGDGTCDQECNTIACLWDGDDCDGVLPEGMALNMYGGNTVHGILLIMVSKKLGLGTKKHSRH